MAHQSATSGWQRPRLLPAGSGNSGQRGSPGWALATLGREASHPAFSQSRGLGALPGAFQAPQPLLSRLRHWAGASPRRPDSLVQAAADASGLGNCKGPAHSGDSGPAKEQRLAFPSSQTVTGNMGPGSQRALFLLLLLFASPGARAFQVSVPVARLGIPLPRR